jgi:hypothetical protein
MAYNRQYSQSQPNQYPNPNYRPPQPNHYGGPPQYGYNQPPPPPPGYYPPQPGFYGQPQAPPPQYGHSGYMPPNQPMSGYGGGPAPGMGGPMMNGNLKLLLRNIISKLLCYVSLFFSDLVEGLIYFFIFIVYVNNFRTILKSGVYQT